MSIYNTAGNPRAHRIRVFFNETSTKIYEGMPVCYAFDTTTNWFGGSVTRTPSADAGVVSASTTTAEGSQNEGKYILVESPDADNLHAFAGVVAPGSWCGVTTSSAKGRIIDIYIPNGAIVPVRADVACTVGKTILSVNNGDSACNTTGRPIAIAAETVDRSSTAGLVLATLDPNRFIWQRGDAAALVVDDNEATSTIILNHVYLNNSQTAGSFVPFMIQSTHDGNTSATSHQYGILDYMSLEGTYDQAGYNRCLLAQLNLAGTLNSGGAHFYAIMAQLSGTPTATEVGHLAALSVDLSVGVNPTTGNYTGIVIANNGANQTQVDSAITIYGNYGINHLFDWESCDGLTANFISNLGTGASKVITSGTAGTTYKIKCNYGGSDVYLIAYSDPTEAAN